MKKTILALGISILTFNIGILLIPFSLLAAAILHFGSIPFLVKSAKRLEVQYETHKKQKKLISILLDPQLMGLSAVKGSMDYFRQGCPTMAISSLRSDIESIQKKSPEASDLIRSFVS